MPTSGWPIGGRVSSWLTRAARAGRMTRCGRWMPCSVRARMPWRSGRRPCAAGLRPPGPYRWLGGLPAEGWLEGGGPARRISVSSEPAAAADAQVWLVVELWDYGLAVDITPPGPDEVLASAEAYRMAEEEPPGRNA